MNKPKHDTTKITDRHPDGRVREVAAYVQRDGQWLFYARGRIDEAISSATQNPDLRGAKYEIDLPRQDGSDEQNLTFGQPVTLDELREISARSVPRRVTCIKAEGYESSGVTVGRTYVMLGDAMRDRLRIVDDKGEQYLYPKAWFQEIP